MRLVGRRGVGAEAGPFVNSSRSWVPLLPLAGVVVGAVLTAVFTLWAERRRWEREDKLRSRNQVREDRQRWLADRRQHYAAFLHAAHRAELAGGRAQGGFQAAQVPGDAQSAEAHTREGLTEWDRYIDALAAMDEKVAELEVVAPPYVAAIAAELVVAVRALVEDSGSGNERGNTALQHSRLLEEYKRAVRLDLDVDSDRPPHGFE